MTSGISEQGQLAAAIEQLRVQLESWIATRQATAGAAEDNWRDAGLAPDSSRRPKVSCRRHEDADASSTGETSALDRMSTIFQLSAFERAILVGVAAMELDGSFAELFGQAQSGPPYPTFGLFLKAFVEGHWDAVAPSAPLRAWRLVKLDAGETLVSRRLSIDERILHYLLGVACPDDRLSGLYQTAAASAMRLPVSQQMIALRAASAWIGALPILQFTGSDAATRESIASSTAARAGLQLATIAVALLPTNATELHAIACLLDREAALGGCALLLPLEDIDPGDTVRSVTVRNLINNMQAPVILSARDPQNAGARATAVFEVSKPAPREQRQVWEEALGSCAATFNGALDRLSSHFHLSAEKIHAHSRLALGMSEQPDGGLGAGSTSPLADTLWNVCRTQSRGRMDELAQRVAGEAGWDDLVLPPLQMQLLRTIAEQMRQRLRVHDTWGFCVGSGRGMGIAAIFAGVSGTGKTTAAEVLANELKLDLYRVDLSHTISKYIGETARNLCRIFDAAEEAGAVLLFDEADALFGKRTEVKDSHDRYANTEVSYLLQRMELYRGLAVLATNMKQAIDPAFLRRVRFVVQFPFPDQSMREAIWRRAMPAQAPVDGLDYAGLSRLSMTGGNIHNIALNGAFAAAHAGEPIRMAHLREAARAEAAKLERPLAEHEIRGWV